MAVKVYNDIIRDGRVVRGSIGISWHPGQGGALEAFGLDHGVMVETVSDKGPADKAGIKADDVIVSLNDRPVKDGADLVTRVADMPIGSTTSITVDRNGKKLDFKVGIGERSVVWQGDSRVTDAGPKEAAPLPTATRTPSSKFGITIQRLTEKEREDLLIEDKSGVKVVTVDPGSFADDIGLQDGDTILSINRIPVMSPDDVMRVQGGFKPGQPVAVHVARSTAGGKHAQPLRFYLSGHLPTD
jgi:serine protease Do